MALIELVDPASDPTYEALDSATRYENESPYRRARMHNPSVLRAQIEYSERLLEAGLVDEQLFEYIMVAVAQANDCDYCAGSHRLKLQSIADVSEETIKAMADGDLASLSERERAVVRFAEQVTVDPHRVREADIEALYAVGFEDADLIQLLAVVGECNTANMIVSALNITPADRDDDLPIY